MPIYEYRCRSCGKKNAFLVMSLNRPPELVCRSCGSRDLEKLVSRVAVLRSEGDRLERMADPAGMAGLDENDPRSMARWMKKMGGEMGDELGQDFDQEMEESLAGGGGEDGFSSETETGEGPADTSGDLED